MPTLALTALSHLTHRHYTQKPAVRCGLWPNSKALLGENVDLHLALSPSIHTLATMIAWTQEWQRLLRSRHPPKPCNENTRMREAEPGTLVLFENSLYMQPGIRGYQGVWATGIPGGWCSLGDVKQKAGIEQQLWGHSTSRRCWQHQWALRNFSTDGKIVMFIQGVAFAPRCLDFKKIKNCVTINADWNPTCRGLRKGKWGLHQFTLRSSLLWFEH